MQIHFADSRPSGDYALAASPSYVPIPYPKTREEIIQDVTYAVKTLFMNKDSECIVLVGKTPFEEAVEKLFCEKPIYRIGKIFKVKNRNNRRAEDYTWLILVENEAGRNIAHMSMGAEGLFLSGAGLSPEIEKNLLYSNQEILKRIEEATGSPLDKNKVKHCERMVLDSTLIGDKLYPSWEIELTNGTVYYYSTIKDEVFQISKRIPLKITSKGHYESVSNYISAETDGFAWDSLADEFIIFKRLGKKK